MNPTIRASNLIGPEKILKQSVAVESNSSSKMSKHHYNPMNRMNSKLDKNQQASSTPGNTTPWTQPKPIADKHQQLQQSIWANNTVIGGSSHQVDQLSSHDSFGGGAQHPGHSFHLPVPVSANDHSHLKLRIDSQFSSVLEDVEMEQQTSPLRRKTPRNGQEPSFTGQTSQQSLLVSYGGAGFQINKTSVANPFPR